MRLKDMSLAKAALLALAIPAQAIAAPGIVECTYQDNGKSHIIKFSPATWHFWDNKAWAWKEELCLKYPGSFGYIKEREVPCQISVNEDEYLFKQYAEYNRLFDREGRPAPFRNYFYHREIFRIDRQTGDMRNDIESYVMVGEKRIDYNTVSLKGTCEAADDPSLQPKPGPKL